jgi:hypothetical protein
MQLQLFDVPAKKSAYPYCRKPTATEKEIIDTVFAGCFNICFFLNDVYNLSPFDQLRYEKIDMQTMKFYITIGASCRQEGYFYMLDVENGNIVMKWQGHTYPYTGIEKPVYGFGKHRWKTLKD